MTSIANDDYGNATREVWRQLLSTFVNWQDERIDAWTRRFSDDLDDLTSMFWHESPIYWVLPLLIPRSIEEMINDRTIGPGSFVGNAEDVIASGMNYFDKMFDWVAASDRWDAHLRKFGDSLNNLRVEHAEGMVPAEEPSLYDLENE